jgi:hypothetical protein
MGEIRFMTSPFTERCGIWEWACGASISNMNKGCDGSPPKGGRESGFCEKCICTFNDGTVSAFCNTILVGLVSLCMSSLNTMFEAKLNKGFAYIFTTFIVLKFNDAKTGKRIFGICFVDLECFKCLTFDLERVYTPKT